MILFASTHNVLFCGVNICTRRYRITFNGINYFRFYLPCYTSHISILLLVSFDHCLDAVIISEWVLFMVFNLGLILYAANYVTMIVEKQS